MVSGWCSGFKVRPTQKTQKAPITFSKAFSGIWRCLPDWDGSLVECLCQHVTATTLDPTLNSGKHQNPIVDPAEIQCMHPQTLPPSRPLRLRRLSSLAGPGGSLVHVGLVEGVQGNLGGFSWALRVSFVFGVFGVWTLSRHTLPLTPLHLRLHLHSRASERSHQLHRCKKSRPGPPAEPANSHEPPNHESCTRCTPAR